MDWFDLPPWSRIGCVAALLVASFVCLSGGAVYWSQHGQWLGGLILGGMSSVVLVMIVLFVIMVMEDV